MKSETWKLAGLVSLLVAVALTGWTALFRTLAGPPPVTLAPVVVTLPAGTPVAGAPIEAFFTRPQTDPHPSLRGGLDEQVAATIARAQSQIDLAAYDFNLWSLRDALVSAYRHGVQVRVVAESDHLDRPEFGDLEKAGIPVVGDEHQGLMHHKFLVIDGHEVWTGSMNFTLNGVYRNDNNLVHLRSTRVAQDFTVEFEEMFTAHRFGPDSLADTPFPRVTLNGVPVEVYFAPDDHPIGRVREVVGQAQQQVLFMVFSFTDDDLAADLIRLYNQGVEVRGVFEEQQVAYSQGNEYPHFKEAGVPVRLDGNPHNLHHKVIIVDGRWVITGSYNFTRSAEERNDENLLIFDSPELAQAYQQEFERVWGLAQP